jgi:hypothetical protein
VENAFHDDVPQYTLQYCGNKTAGNLDEMIRIISRLRQEDPMCKWLLSDRISKAVVRFDPFMNSNPYDPLQTEEGSSLLKLLRSKLA